MNKAKPLKVKVESPGKSVEGPASGFAKHVDVTLAEQANLLTRWLFAAQGLRCVPELGVYFLYTKRLCFTFGFGVVCGGARACGKGLLAVSRAC